MPWDIGKQNKEKNKNKKFRQISMLAQELFGVLKFFDFLQIICVRMLYVCVLLRTSEKAITNMKYVFFLFLFLLKYNVKSESVFKGSNKGGLTSHNLNRFLLRRVYFLFFVYFLILLCMAFIFSKFQRN